MFNVISPRSNPYAFRRDDSIHMVHTGKGFWKLTIPEAESLLQDLLGALNVYPSDLGLYAEQNRTLRQADREGWREMDRAILADKGPA